MMGQLCVWLMAGNMTLLKLYSKGMVIVHWAVDHGVILAVFAGVYKFAPTWNYQKEIGITPSVY